MIQNFLWMCAWEQGPYLRAEPGPRSSSLVEPVLSFVGQPPAAHAGEVHDGRYNDSNAVIYRIPDR